MVSLDQFKGMNQIGDTGLRHQVHNHYLKIFGASLAVGAIGGIAEAVQVDWLLNPAPKHSRWCGPESGQTSQRILDEFADRDGPRRPPRQDLPLR